MFRSLRYQNPVIRDHLAAQYAMGLLTPLVKKRVERFMAFDASFEKEVRQWQEKLSSINDLIEPVAVPVELKHNLMASLGIEDKTTKKQGIAVWLNSLLSSVRFWQGLTASSVACLLVLFLQFGNTDTEPVNRLAYVAVMQSTLAERDQEPSLIVTAYKKTEEQASRLDLRWNDRVSNDDIAGKTLWAVARSGGETVKLATLTTDTKTLSMTKEQWSQVANSLELLVIDGDQASDKVVLRGLCLQLTDWT